MAADDTKDIFFLTREGWQQGPSFFFGSEVEAVKAAQEVTPDTVASIIVHQRQASAYSSPDWMVPYCRLHASYTAFLSAVQKHGFYPPDVAQFFK